MHDNPDREAPTTPAQGIEPPTVAIPPGGKPGEDFELQGVPEALPFDGGDEAVPFGDYELLGELGRGGMGVVYRARERHSGRIVALKMMLNEAAPKSAELRRFRLEARAAGQLSHPGIISVHSWGEHQNALFYTMDYVPGVPLSQLMVKSRLPCDRAVRYLIGMAQAVAAAHAQGIVHRDLKPGNVIIDPHDQPRVLDFGLAKRQQAVTGEASGVESIVDVLPADANSVALAQPSQDTDSRFQRATRKGTIVGTPAYMAPEQASGDHGSISPATDVHALGAIFYEMLMGRPPYQGGSVMETLQQVRQREPDLMWVEGKRVPAVLEAVCLRCLRKDPRDRYPDAGALADDLEAKWERARQGKRFARLAVAAGAVGLLLAHLGLVSARTLWAAPGDSPVERSILGQAVWLTALILFGAALLAQAASLAALSAWVWRASRVWPVLLVGCGALLAATLAVLAGEGAAQFGLAVFSMLGAGVIGITWLARAAYASEQSVIEASSPRTEPFLHRLLGGAGGTAPPPKSAPAAAPIANGLADIEKGKVVQSWEGGLVYRGRQKSLERPVLVWLDSTPTSPETPLPGVYVRHPGVLVLHAVGTCPEGRYLVTEFAPTTPLAELQQRQALPPHDAVHIAAGLALAVQAIHDQGACLGSLRPEWIMLRSGLEPVLCPWCLPSQAAEDRVRNGQALGRLLLDWLPPRPPRWQRRPFAVVHAVADAAAQGRYARLADLANDLARALEEASLRQRNRWAGSLIVVLAALPWLVLLLTQSWAEETLAPYLVPALIPAAILLGYRHVKTLIYRGHFRYTVPLAVPRNGLPLMSVQLALLTLPPALVIWNGGTGLLAAGLLLGYWILGAGLAGLAMLASLFLRHLRPRLEQAAAEPEAI
jgi:serine/threonine protein kinase